MSLPLEGKLMKMTRKGENVPLARKIVLYTTVSLAASIRRALRLVRMNVATNAAHEQYNGRGWRAVDEEA